MRAAALLVVRPWEATTPRRSKSWAALAPSPLECGTSRSPDVMSALTAMSSWLPDIAGVSRRISTTAGTSDSARSGLGRDLAPADVGEAQQTGGRVEVELVLCDQDVATLGGEEPLRRVVFVVSGQGDDGVGPVFER